MHDTAEFLGSWAVEISAKEGSPTIILTINGKSIRLPLTGADLLGQALREQAAEAAVKARSTRSANDPA